MKKILLSICYIGIMVALSSCEEDAQLPEETVPGTSSRSCENVSTTFSINLDPSDCTVDIEEALGVSSLYTESVSGTTRSIRINSVANHQVGVFPNPGNPNSIRVQSKSYSVPTNPTAAASVTSGQGHEVAVLFSGVTVDPFTAEFFRTSTGGFNREWNITTLTHAVNLGLDCNNAHVQPTGKYHYHAAPSAYVAQLGINGSEMVKVGYAGDGFPVYYKYVLAEDGTTLMELESGYRLKDGSRPGDGNTAPDGCYDGTYFQDYEYVAGVSDLDACNGRFGPTPDSPNGEYYYVITENFPSVPLCFTGTPDASFRFGPPN